MFIDNFIILKEKINTILGNFYLGKLHPNNCLKNYIHDAESDVIVLMKEDSPNDMIGMWINDCGETSEYVNNICIADEDYRNMETYKAFIEFLYLIYNKNKFSFSIYNVEAIKAAESLGFVITNKIPGHIPYTTAGVFMEKYYISSINSILESHEKAIESFETQMQKDSTKKRFKIVTLCGSTRFKKEFQEAMEQLTLKGYIVLSVCVFSHADHQNITNLTSETRQMLNEIHHEKIRMSDEIFVINKDHYIGESTKSEIEFAKSLGIKINYLE